MALEVAYILKSSHIEHINCSIVTPSNDLTFWQFQHYIDCSRMVLTIWLGTDGKEADLAIFLTPVGGILAKGSIIAFGLDSF